MTLKRFALSCTLVTAMCGLSLSTGCASDEITGASVRGNLAPELFSVAETDEQNATRVMRAWNYDGRMLIDDWNTFWLVDKTSKLSAYPIP